MTLLPRAPVAALQRVKNVHLNRTVTVKQPADVADGQGGFTRTWATFASLRALIQPVQSYVEQVFHGQLQAQVTHRVLVEYTAGITNQMRVYFGTRIFEIQAVRDIGDDHVIVALDCREFGQP